MKTFANWKGNLTEYLQIGDLVDEEMVDYFIDVMPPATFNSQCVQMGEPYDHINGRATFSTLKKTADGWVYVGHCFRGKTSLPQVSDGN